MPVSPRTQEAYLACVRQWAEHFNTAHVATNSMVCATYFETAPEAASRYSRPAGVGTAFSYHQNASTQGPPTSSAVQVNLGRISGTWAARCLANRVRNATASGSINPNVACVYSHVKPSFGGR